VRWARMRLRQYSEGNRQFFGAYPSLCPRACARRSFITRGGAIFRRSWIQKPRPSLPASLPAR
jgi:hypothetical protein